MNNQDKWLCFTLLAPGKVRSVYVMKVKMQHVRRKMKGKKILHVAFQDIPLRRKFYYSEEGLCEVPYYLIQEASHTTTLKKP